MFCAQGGQRLLWLGYYGLAVLQHLPIGFLFQSEDGYEKLGFKILFLQMHKVWLREVNKLT